MSRALGREKDLPDIPAGGQTVAGFEDLWLISSTNKVFPSVNVQKSLSEEEMGRLHELWNVAGLSARAHRRRRRGQNSTPCRIPAPISVLGPESIPPSLPSADPPIMSSTLATTGSRKRWGFLNARPFSETQEVDKKTSNTLGTLRAIAQNRLKTKLRYAKSTPNLGDQATGAILQPDAPLPVEAVSTSTGPRIPRNPSLPDTLAAAVIKREDMDENAIYFTIDSNWRASRDSVQFQFITPIPDNSSSDSPLHRRRSLDQWSAATAFTAADFPEEACPSHPIDELHAYLGF